MLSRLKKWGALILGVFSALSWLITAWFRRKVKKTEEKLEKTEQELVTEQVKVKVKTHETEAVKEAVKYDNQADKKEQEQIHTIEQADSESDVRDSINDMLDKFNNGL